MIGRIDFDGRQYEVELSAANRLYNFATGDWDVAEIKSVIRGLERLALFDKPIMPAIAGKGNAP